MSLLIEFLNAWFPQHDEHVKMFDPEPAPENNFDSFLNAPDPRDKLAALVHMYGDLDKALEQLNLLEKQRYINNIDAAKIRKIAHYQ